MKYLQLPGGGGGGGLTTVTHLKGCIALILHVWFCFSPILSPCCLGQYGQYCLSVANVGAISDVWCLSTFK